MKLLGFIKALASSFGTTYKKQKYDVTEGRLYPWFYGKASDDYIITGFIDDNSNLIRQKIYLEYESRIAQAYLAHVANVCCFKAIAIEKPHALALPWHPHFKLAPEHILSSNSEFWIYDPDKNKIEHVPKGKMFGLNWITEPNKTSTFNSIIYYRQIDFTNGIDCIQPPTPKTSTKPDLMDTVRDIVKHFK